MVLGEGIRFLWLDKNFDREEDYQGFKDRFHNTLEGVLSVPPDSINVLIWTLEQNIGLFFFTNKVHKAIKYIRTHRNKRIVLISSASLAKFLLPRISSKYPHVYYYYIFCQYIENYVNSFMKYSSCLLMFNHETDLLVRVARDRSKDIIQAGQIYLDIQDARNALKCFHLAVTLNEKANQLAGPENLYFPYLRQLNGHENSVGLIQQATQMLNKQQ